ncbi:MAG: 4-alpha-glucanotransferase, partial [Persephonella sp.]
NKIKNKKIDNDITEYLLQSQCNDALWHGVFGGIYLPILRNNAYIAINHAEKIIDKNEYIIEVIDFNNDGYNEVIYKNSFTI